MLQIKLNASNQYEITDKKVNASLDGATVTVQQQSISSPGEYEANGVEVVYGEKAALLVWERLQTVYVFTAETPNGFDKDQFSSADVIIVAAGIPELTKEKVTDLLEAYDPTVVILSNATKIDESLAAALKVQAVPMAKLSEQTLPAEGREFYSIG